MDSKLKILLNNNKQTNYSIIPGLTIKEKKSNKQTMQNSLKNAKDSKSIPSSFISDNFAEKIQKEKSTKFQKENLSKTKNELVKENNKLKNLPSENFTKNTLNSLNFEEKIKMKSIEDSANKILTKHNKNMQIKNMNISSNYNAVEAISQLNLNNSLSTLMNFNSKNYKMNNNMNYLISIPNAKNHNLNLKISNENSNLINTDLNAIANVSTKSNKQINQIFYNDEKEEIQQELGIEVNNQQKHNNIKLTSVTEKNYFSNQKKKNQIISPMIEANQFINQKSTDYQISLLNTDVTIQDDYLSVVPKPKNMKISSYIERQVEIYSNIYPLKLTKNYSIYTYYIDFQGDSDHINTYLKRKIISKAFSELIDIYGVYFFSGENFYATNKIKEVVNIISNYKKVKYSFLIRPLVDFIEMKDYKANQKNRSLFKNILELIYKDILKANPDVKMSKNMCGKKCTEKIVYTHKNKVLVIPAFSTKIMLLEAGIFLNVDNKNKILNGESCLSLIRESMQILSRPTGIEVKAIINDFKDKMVETKHTNQRFKIDSISFDKTPKNTSLNYDGKFFF